jgi:hypothetical protein
VALQRALAARVALQGQAQEPVDVIVRDAQQRQLLHAGGGVLQLAPALFDGDQVRPEDQALLHAVADGIAAGRVATVEVPAGDRAQARVSAVRAIFAERLPPGTEPRIQAAGAPLQPDPTAANGEGAR